MEGSVKRQQPLTSRIDLRISEEKYQELSALVARTRGVQNLSQLIRKILEEGKITIETYDTSNDKLMDELSAIRRELHAIGVNINQVTRRFHSQKTPESRLASVLEITRLFQQADLRLTEVFTIISKIAEGWLPK